MGSMFEEPLIPMTISPTTAASSSTVAPRQWATLARVTDHPLHGELPNAHYQRAELLIGSDGDGPYMGLAGSYRHTVAFTHNYEARPTVQLGAESSRIFVKLSIRNMKRTPMELMYLAHINFRPVDGATIVDTVPNDPAHIRLRTTLPQVFAPNEQHRHLVEAIGADIASHRLISQVERSNLNWSWPSIAARTQTDGHTPRRYFPTVRQISSAIVRRNSTTQFAG